MTENSIRDGEAREVEVVENMIDEADLENIERELESVATDTEDTESEEHWKVEENVEGLDIEIG